MMPPDDCDRAPNTCLRLSLSARFERVIWALDLSASQPPQNTWDPGASRIAHQQAVWLGSASIIRLPATMLLLSRPANEPKSMMHDLLKDRIQIAYLCGTAN